MSTASSSLARSVGNGAAMALFVTTLFHARTQIHQLHLQTKSFAAHIALDELYKDIIELVDDVAEAYQGKYTIIPFEEVKCPIIKSGNEVQFVQQLISFVSKQRKELPEDSELQNMIDEIASLLDSKLYKLRFLS